jgi:hypothetical protein
MRGEEHINHIANSDFVRLKAVKRIASADSQDEVFSLNLGDYVLQRTSSCPLQNEPSSSLDYRVPTGCRTSSRS